MKANDVIITQTELKDFTISNDYLESIDLEIIGHFGNVVSVRLLGNCWGTSPYVNTANAGFVVKALVELLDLEEEDGISLSKIKHVPIRTIFAGNEIKGIGSFISDKFILLDHLFKINEQSTIK